MTDQSAPAKISLWRQTLLFLRDQRSLWLKASCFFALMNAGLLLAYHYITMPLSLAAYALKLSPNYQDGLQIWWNAFSWRMVAAFLLCVLAKYAQFYFFGTRFLTLKGIPCALSGKQFGHFVWKKVIVDVLIMASVALWLFVIFNLSLFLALALKNVTPLIVLGVVICFVLFILSGLLLIKVFGRLYVVPSLALFSSGDELKTSWRLAKGKIIRILGNAFVLAFAFDLLILGIPLLHFHPLVGVSLEGMLTALMNVVMIAFNALLLRQLQQEHTPLP